MDNVNNPQNDQSVSQKQVTRSDSYFDGNTWQLIGYRILSALVNTITLGIAYPWMLCMVQRWEVKHTVIHGRRLKFNGHGHQLIGKYLLWVFFTIITFGIYGIWLGLGMKKWVVKHTVYADDEKPVDSYFSGGAGGYLGIHILSFVLTLFTFGVGKAWADRMVLKWEAKHTHIGGSPLEFNGTGGQLFVKYLLLALLTPLTLGIYALFFAVIYKKWEVKHTEAVYQTPEIQAKAKAHELTAVQDFAKYRIAANDQEIAAMKSGYTGKEDPATLEQMAEDGNPFAAYHLARQLKGENALYEDKALELLQKAADGKVHSALLDLAKQAPAEQKVSMLTESAQCGNAQASWLLAVEYKNANNLPQAAYWFKVAMEWGAAEASAHTDEYDEIVKNIALQLSEDRVMPQRSKALPIVLGVVGAVLLAVVAFGVMAIFGLTREGAIEPAAQVIYLDAIDVNEIQGETYSLDDQKGHIEYIIDEDVFFDRSRNVLHIHFGLSEYAEYVYLRGDYGWRTQAIVPETGVTEVSCPSGNAPSYIEIWSKYDETEGHFIVTHHLYVTEGTTAEAQEWLDAKYGSENQKEGSTADGAAPPVVENMETPSTSTAPEVNLADSIVGDWVYYDMLTNMTTGDDTLEVWEFAFNSDGTYGFVHNECMVSTEGGIYYGGKCWSAMLGYGQDGTYSMNGDKLTVQYYLDGENAVLTTTDYTVELHENNLSIYCDGWGRTRDFERK